jgi:hypothetical protein
VIPKKTMSDALARTPPAASFVGGTLERGMSNQVVGNFEVKAF